MIRPGLDLAFAWLFGFFVGFALSVAFGYWP